MAASAPDARLTKVSCFVIGGVSCNATDSDSLTSAASSGKCGVVTLLNDITIPQNQTVNVAANTIINGHGYTLSSSGANPTYNMQNNTGFENVKFNHDFPQLSKEVSVMAAQNSSYNVSLRDVQINVTSSATDEERYGYFIGQGKYNVSETLNATLGKELGLTKSNSLNIQNSSMSLSGRSINAFSDASYSIVDSTVNIAGSASRYYQRGTSGYIKNSTVTVYIGSLFTRSDLQTLTLAEGTKFSITATTYLTPSSSANHKIIMQGTAAKPVNLTMNITQNLQGATITTNNTTDTLVLNDVTYKPTKAATTLFSDVPTSSNWKKQ